MKVSILIPVFNLVAHTKQCLESLKRSLGSHEIEIVVINNCSTDETSAYLQEVKDQFPFPLHIINLSANLGFAEACNKGARLASGEIFLFLNNDTIVREGWLTELLKGFTDERVGVCAPKLVSPFSNNINHAGYVFGETPGSFYPLYHDFESYLPCVTKERAFQAVLGAALATPRDLFFKVGGFAPIGLEDIDYCLRVRSRGYDVKLIPKSVIAHYGSLSYTNNSASLIVGGESTDAFNSRWPSIETDDERYLQEDGFTVQWLGSDSTVYTHKTDRSFSLVQEGIKLALRGEWDGAEQSFKQASVENPTRKVPFLHLASLFAEQKRSDELEEALIAVMHREPRDYEVSLMLMETFRLRDDFAQAESLKERLLGDADVPLEIRVQASSSNG